MLLANRSGQRLHAKGGGFGADSSFDEVIDAVGTVGEAVGVTGLGIALMVRIGEVDCDFSSSHWLSPILGVGLWVSE